MMVSGSFRAFRTLFLAGFSRVRFMGSSLYSRGADGSCRRRGAGARDAPADFLKPGKQRRVFCQPDPQPASALHDAPGYMNQGESNGLHATASPLLPQHQALHGLIAVQRYEYDCPPGRINIIHRLTEDRGRRRIPRLPFRSISQPRTTENRKFLYSSTLRTFREQQSCAGRPCR